MTAGRRRRLLLAATAGAASLAGWLVVRVRSVEHDPGATPARARADCVVQGVTYHSGDTLPSFDHCNGYTCQDGAVYATAMACPPAPDAGAQAGARPRPHKLRR